jgi:Protein of unknown function (DUF732)
MRLATPCTASPFPWRWAVRLSRAVACCHAIGLSVIASGPAHGDSAEAVYIKVLNENNIHYGARSHGLAMGHAVCEAVDTGEYTAGTVAGALRRDDRLSYADAAAISAAAIAIFCPWNKSWGFTATLITFAAGRIYSPAVAQRRWS